MKEETKGLYLAVLLSILIIFVVNYFMPTQQMVDNGVAPAPTAPEISSVDEDMNAASLQSTPKTSEDIIKSEERISVETPSLNGSIRLKGARFDSLKLAKYKQTLDADSPDVELLAPSGSQAPYFAEIGWLSSDTNLKLPNSETLWHVRGQKLTPQSPLTFEWDNGQGLKFVRTVSVDEHYLFTITQTVENNTNNPVVLYPYGLISRIYNPDNANRSAVVH